MNLITKIIIVAIVKMLIGVVYLRFTGMQLFMIHYL